jgi:hypothetical protein
MGWQGQEQDVFHLVLHAKQVYLGPKSLNPSSSTLTLFSSPSQALGGREGGSNHAATILLLIMAHTHHGYRILLVFFSVSASL